MVSVGQIISRVEFLTDSVAFTFLDETMQVEALAYDARDNAIPSAPFAYTSSDVTVVTVDEDGLATSVAVGSATINRLGGLQEAAGCRGTELRTDLRQELDTSTGVREPRIDRDEEDYEEVSDVPDCRCNRSLRCCNRSLR